MNLSYAIAITGGISTGKSTVCSLLKLYGYSVIDADLIAHSVLDSLQSYVIEEFGDSILSGSKIDRKKLGKIVFSNPDKKKSLENILHPEIKNRILTKSLELENFCRCYFIDIPLFFELRDDYPINKSVLVYAPFQIQLSRLIKRDKISIEDAIARINSQINIEDKRHLADYVIDNSNDLQHLKSQVELFLESSMIIR